MVGEYSMNEIRLLRCDEIECRVGSINDKGVTLLLYKDARVDMKLLDETFGPYNWQRKHVLIGGNLYCELSVWDDKKQTWITKADVGVENFAEKEKSMASDSFKRASTVWGIGRELYTKISIWIPASKVKIQRQGERYITYDKFKVKDITYDDKREISGIVIVNQDQREVYVLKDNKQKNGSVQVNNLESKVVSMNKELVRTGVALDAVLGRYGVKSIQEMSDDTYRKAMSGLKRTKDKTKFA